MTPIEKNTLPVENAPVSRIQRFLPFLSFGIVGLGGALAGYYAKVAVTGFANSETAGIGAIGSALAAGMSAITVSLVLAILVGAVAIIVYLGMMFADRKTGSPSSLQLLLIAILAGLSPACGWCALSIALLAPFSHTTTAEGVAGQTSVYIIASIGLGLLSAAAGLVLTFIPQKGRAGRKYGPLALMIGGELAMIVGLVYITLQIRGLSQIGLGM